MPDKRPTVAIVSLYDDAPGVLALRESAKKIGYTPKVVQLDAKNEHIKMELEQADGIIYRVAPRSYHTYELLYAILSGTPADLLARTLVAFDKIKSYEALIAHDVPTPKSWIITRESSPPRYPFIIKIAQGNQGKGVALIRNSKELNDFFAAHSQEKRFLAQLFIAESEGHDKRLIVAGDDVIAAMERHADASEFRANLHLGGKAQVYAPTKEEEKLAIRAVKSLGLPYGGVDMLDSKAGPLVLEVNPSPGFAIGSVVKKDVATEIIKRVLKEMR